MQYGYGARVRRLLSFTGCLLALALVLGCSGSGGPGVIVVPPATTGTLAGRVTVFGTQAPISNALVTVAGRSANTLPDGSYGFNNLAVGGLTVGVTAAGFSDSTAAVTISAGNTTVHDVVLFATPPAFPNLN